MSFRSWFVPLKILEEVLSVLLTGCGVQFLDFIQFFDLPEDPSLDRGVDGGVTWIVWSWEPKLMDVSGFSVVFRSSLTYSRACSKSSSVRTFNAAVDKGLTFSALFGALMWKSATTVFFLMVNGVDVVFVMRMGTFISWTVDSELASTIGLSSA